MGGERYKWHRLLDIGLIMVAVILLGGLALFVKPSVSADSVALVDLVAATGEGCSAVCTSTGSFCGRCARRAGDRLHGQPGVAWVKVDEDRRRMVVAFDSTRTAAAGISDIITRAGYGNHLTRTMDIAQYDRAPERNIGKLLRQSPCGGACWNGMNKGENK